MFSPLRNRFGIPGVISVIALVFAMFGGAYAASNDSGSADATASAKAKKGPRGPRGPRGKTGPAGPVGPAGPQGLAGAQGAQGPAGADGKSVEVGTPTAEECPDGGATVQVAGEPATKKAVCNGANGEGGGAGLPVALPSGSTLTGAWAASGAGENPIAEAPTGGSNFAAIPISFPIPLSAEIGNSNWEVKPVGYAGAAGANCPGSASEPKAKAGFLCVYISLESGEVLEGEATLDEAVTVQKAGSSNPTAPGASRSGAVLISGFFGEINYAYGTWAVTAP